MITSSNDIPKLVLHPGFKVIGKWSGNSYTIQRLLGEGTSGKVYLVKCNQKCFALKVGLDDLSLQSEINVLKKVNEELGSSERIFVESDDFELQGDVFPYYIMKYIQGVDAKTYIQRNGYQWFYLIGMNILNQLQQLHKKNWIFGDIKVENMIVSDYGSVTLIDYGGVTAKGRSVKQFTEIYDRGYWGKGNRKADEAYDLFSFAILCLILMDSISLSEIKSEQKKGAYLLKRAKMNPSCKHMIPFFEKAIYGKFQSTGHACDEWKKLMYGAGFEQSKSIILPWLEPALASSIFVFLLTLYLSFMH
ncbi:protein kinase domain-containing protein [Chengkuizengella axinellae]|uniref:non-specific serine/threonine protein kinase n=1 Tax=Chengkuizengella axinellae TaxID=3064388 RepID=A0ABT9J7H7_9BACL|nr:serine/threonine protein kinase [Chengkuizengella sp. 2205SS18-9]MDP5276960.1 serine/threonine protein kinase [Chengkuizengella sp. 2205SS18-9]